MPRPANLSLPYHRWPAVDRAAWDAAFADEDVFDRGVGAHLAPRSRATLQSGYARWLGFVNRDEPQALCVAPAARITPDRVRAYITPLFQRCSACTVWNDVKALYDVAGLIAPVQDWTWLKRVKAHLERQVSPRRVTVVDSSVLADLGLNLMRQAVSRLHTSGLEAARAYRDGLIIALLAHRPLRRRTLTALDIDRHLLRAGGTWILDLKPQDLKNRRHVAFTVPDVLNPWFERYLAEVRLRFRGADQHSGLWASSRGGAMTDSAIYQSVRRRTQAEFGKALNLHAVRHGSATTIAIYAPESIATAAILLTHVDPRTTERYYNQAGSISAGHAYASVVDNLSRTAAHQSGGKKRERRRCEP